MSAVCLCDNGRVYAGEDMVESPCPSCHGRPYAPPPAQESVHRIKEATHAFEQELAGRTRYPLTGASLAALALDLDVVAQEATSVLETLRLRQRAAESTDRLRFMAGEMEELWSMATDLGISGLGAMAKQIKEKIGE